MSEEKGTGTTYAKLREAGIKALRAAALYAILHQNEERPHLSALMVETLAEGAADYAYDAYRLLRETGLTPQGG